MSIRHIKVERKSKYFKRIKPQEEPKEQEKKEMSTPKKSKAKLSKRNASGYLGVSATKNGKWGVQITVTVTDKKGKESRQVRWLGRFPGTNEGKLAAAKRYDEEALKEYGDAAELNFPAGK